MAKVKAHHLHYVYVLLLIFAFTLYVGCSGSGSTTREGPADFRYGSQALELRWHESNPRIFYEGDDLSLLVDVYNRGTEEVYGEFFLSGYDPAYLDLQIYPSYFISMEGKDEFDPAGDFGDIITIAANRVRLPNNRERFTQSIKLTACYNYATKASAEVCVDPDPYNRKIEDKVCTLGAQNPGGQGHPVVVTNIDTHISRNDVRFTIDFSNSGTGDVFDQRVSFNACSGGLNYDEIGLISVQSVTLSGRALSCEPLNPVRMRNNQGSIVCECSGCIDEYQSAYRSLLEIDFSYGYRNTITQDIEIVSNS